MSEQEIIDQAITILESRLHPPQDFFASANDVRHYLRLHCSNQEHESFWVMFMNSQHGLIKFQELFRGTIDQSAIYPREVVKMTLQFNAAAVIFAHNHPSGENEPSFADRAITQRLVKALELIDVRVLDHFVIGRDDPYSFAEHGLV